ncbi:MAG: hypothetical protein H0X33_11795 [Taibaiella sp.]|nr:hypothetical protein [Taibaiella sp.]
MEKGGEFWDWFKINNYEYKSLSNLDKKKSEELLNNFLYQLHRYSPGLYFQIGDSITCKELIITADGDEKYFADVERLVDCAPKLESWKIIAFKPPMGIDFVTEYENVVLDPKNIWFLPLDNENNPKVLGMKVYISNFNKENEKIYLSGVYQVLDTILGEKSCTQDIKYVEVARLPTHPEKSGLIGLTELTQYIKWYKEVGGSVPD